ncbi:hypothetical protein PHYBLDRAFT_148421 [Phycomyces blakesleeanus NRRL 1555(-)]|uniref:Uncharacterized protein n=1 Tax=Phycomyces blakesleeanus (strain ATCC 8743b / DSM 1359 / FGSC 10004 / NBRC 33097 / NRRL 1555) TaxID=763407 RepID=A0A162PN42_PHYB8|nr:hypothetical protein PHYBLDRAFT_148421 [Phycomyces blakesleeanus NRRL 1555(-)]OAD70506.1 hypothetical protein PHYBLDRAFT_148421 [Phycomyces blakesleeanus NRRL 1555(-)]|eukprot:XP_018288546.1 hypothetical protein PHYBLDRAFT_148421 [Phycomyces blakesleeanus NRRL 1555(-)]
MDLQKARNDNLVDLFEISFEENITVDGRELQGITVDLTSANHSRHFLKLHEGPDKSLRGTYQMNSLITKWRKRKSMKESFDRQGSYLLTEKAFTISSQKESVNEELELVEVTSKKLSANTISLLKLAFNDIKEEIAPFTRISGSSQPIDHYKLCKLEPAESYLRHRLSGTMIRKYAKEYIDFRSIALHQQGKHAISFSLFSGVDFKASIYKWIQQQKPESRSTILVKKHIDEVVIPKRLEIPESVSTSEDGENCGVTIPQPSTNGIELVLVTHNESTFYSNDGKEAMWLVEVVRCSTLELIEAVFAFDQSTNHKAYTQNALIATKITLGDKEVEEDDPYGVQQVQSMYYKKDEWFAKKNGQWMTKKVKYVKGTCKFLEEHASRPDFMSQKTALHEAVEDSGHIFELYPKFHCKYKNIHTFLDHAGKLPNIRRYYNNSWRYIEAYSQDMNVKEAHDVVKNLTSRKYTSHRRDEGKE